LLAAHETLRYTEGRPAGSVLEAVRRGIGECTDYADLYTTLARAAGLPARTVYGLAYKDGTPPSFMFHAWNEVHSDGAWRAMDPTWNQTVTDATHIPMTDSQAANLMLAHSRSDVAFSVTRAEYL
jgi:transglutaminase-like putative cysteine protease